MNADPAKGNKGMGLNHLEAENLPDRNTYEEYGRMKRLLDEMALEPDCYERMCREMAEGLGI